MASIRDVAHLAGVSTATVSRVFNDNGKIQEKTRQSVWQAAKQLSYKPQRSALSKQKKETRRNVVAFVPDISNPFYATVVTGINDFAANTGYNVFLCNTNYDRRTELQHLRDFNLQKVSGMVFFGGMLTRDELLELNKTTPIVQCG